jgi:hypothetical protein
MGHADQGLAGAGEDVMAILEENEIVGVVQHGPQHRVDGGVSESAGQAGGVLQGQIEQGKPLRGIPPVGHPHAADAAVCLTDTQVVRALAGFRPDLEETLEALAILNMNKRTQIDHSGEKRLGVVPQEPQRVARHGSNAGRLTDAVTETNLERYGSGWCHRNITG